MALFDLIYRGMGEQIGYDVQQIMKTLNEGRALSSLRVSVSPALVQKPVQEFLKRSALGEGVLPAFPFKVPPQQIPPAALARILRQFPMSDPTYRKIFEAGGLAEQSEIPLSEMRRISGGARQGEPEESALYGTIQETPLLTEGLEPEVAEGVYEEQTPRIPTAVTPGMHEPNITSIPKWMRKRFREVRLSPYYAAMRDSLGRNPEASHDLRAIAHDAMSENPGEKGQELRDWLIKVAGMGLHEPVDARDMQKRAKIAGEILKGFTGGPGNQAFAYGRLMEFTPGMGHVPLWGGEEVPQVIRQAYSMPPMVLPRRIVSSADYTNLALAGRLEGLKDPAEYIRQGRPALLPRRTQRALLLGLADDIYGDGSSKVLPPMLGWMHTSQAEGANAVRMWWQNRFGRLPEDEGSMIVDMLTASAAIGRYVPGQEGFARLKAFQATKLVHRGLAQGLLRLYLDDIAAEVVPTAPGGPEAYSRTLETLYTRLGKAFLSPGFRKIVGPAAALGLVAAFVSQKDLMPKAEAAGVSDPIKQSLGRMAARMASAQAASVAGQTVEETVADILSLSPRGTGQLLEIGKAVRRWGRYFGMADETVLQNQIQYAKHYLPPAFGQELESQLGELMQRASWAREKEFAMANQTQLLAQDIYKWAKEDGVQATKGQEFENWMQPIRDTIRRGEQYFKTLTPHQRLAAQSVQKYYKETIDTARKVDESIRPSRLNYFTYAYDPFLVRNFLRNPAAIEAMVHGALPERIEELQRLAGVPPEVLTRLEELNRQPLTPQEMMNPALRRLRFGITADGFNRFLREVGRTLGTAEMKEVRTAIEANPGVFTNVVRGIAVKEINQYMAILANKVGVPGLGRTIDEIVLGEMGLLPGEGGAGFGGIGRIRPANRSPYFTNPQKFRFAALEYKDPLSALVSYGAYGGRHIAYASEFGPKGEFLNQVLKNIVTMKNMHSVNPESMDAILGTLKRLFDRDLGHSTDTISEIGRVLIPLSIISRMQLTAIPHFFQGIFNPAAATSWASTGKAALEIAKGNLGELDRLVAMSGNLMDFSLSRELAGRLVSGQRQVELASDTWLGYIGFKPVRRLLLQSSALSAHFETTNFLKRITALEHNPEEAAKVAGEFKNFLRRAGFGRRLTLEQRADIAESLVEAYKKGEIVDDPRAMARMERLGIPSLKGRDPYLRVLNAATNLTAQNFNPWEFPEGWNTPVGRIWSLFRRFFYLQARNMVGMAVNEAKEGNLGPLFTLAVPYSIGGEVLLNARAWLRGKPSPLDDPRAKPMMIGGVILPKGLQTYLIASTNSGAFGLFDDLFQISVNPNQPYLGIQGLILGLLPMEFVQMATDIAQVFQSTVTGGLDPAKTNDFAAARRFLGLWVNMIPFVGAKWARKPPFITGRAWYLDRKRQAVGAYLDGDYATFVAIQKNLHDEMLPDVTPSDIMREMERRRARQQGVSPRPPLAGQPGYQQYRETGSYPGMPNTPVELPAMPSTIF